MDNLLKYTGYGNAAGLLLARGLLAGGRGETQYSEDEDSDTEEYKSAKPLYAPPTPPSRRVRYIRALGLPAAA